MKKLGNTEDELKKALLIKKECIMKKVIHFFPENYYLPMQSKITNTT